MKGFLCLLILLFPALTGAAGTPGVCHNELSEWIKSRRQLAIVDVQDSAGFRAHNYDHSLVAGTNPGRLKKIAAQLRGKQRSVIVVSADGGQDAEQAVEQLVRSGVNRSRILILEGGMAAAAKNAVCDCCKPVRKVSLQ